MKIRSRLEIGTYIVFTFFLIRLFTFVCHSPLYGYDNNGDFFRLTTFYGLNPVGPAPAFQGPYSKFVFDRTPNIFTGVISSELLFVDIALKLSILIKRFSLDSRPELFDLIYLGMVKGFAFVLICGVLSRILWRRNKQSSFLFILAMLAIGADPFNTLFFNSFYTEFSALLFFISSFVVTLVCASSYRWRYLGLLNISFILLLFSKPQHVYLPFVFIVFLWISIFFVRERKEVVRRCLGALVTSFIALTAANLQSTLWGHQGSHAWMTKNTVRHTVFQAILPESSHPSQTLELLGLSSECLGYQKRLKYDDIPGCSGIEALSHRKIVKVLLHEPLLLPKLLIKMIPQSRYYLYNVRSAARPSNGVVNFNSSFLTFSLGAAMDSASEFTFYFLFIGTVILSALHSLRLLQCLLQGRIARLRSLYFSISGILILFIMAVSILGDGFTMGERDLARHCQLANELILCSPLIFLALMLKDIQKKIYPRDISFSHS